MILVILYVVLGLIALALLIAAVLPGKYLVEKTIVIKRPAAEVYNKVADLNYYKAWNPWAKMEPDAQTAITGSPMHVGHKYYWNGKKVGEGSLTVRSATPGKAINFDLVFLKPFKSAADDAWDFTDTADGTKVVWRNRGTFPFPVARLMGPSITKQLNGQFEEGLRNLKEMCEQ
ncbi:MAG: SRPBCC family protein [Chitinophagaceae bacterium]|nr:SRPBCC family protein [Chitinophagaceae bacterium]